MEKNERVFGIQSDLQAPNLRLANLIATVYQKTGKQLMTEDEIAVMDGGKCILQIRGARPFFSDKYDITKHKNYRLLADENEKNRYKVETELNPQYTPKPEEEVEVIHVELSE